MGAGAESGYIGPGLTRASRSRVEAKRPDRVHPRLDAEAVQARLHEIARVLGP